MHPHTSWLCTHEIAAIKGPRQSWGPLHSTGNPTLPSFTAHQPQESLRSWNSSCDGAQLSQGSEYGGADTLVRGPSTTLLCSHLLKPTGAASSQPGLSQPWSWLGTELPQETTQGHAALTWQHRRSLFPLGFLHQPRNVGWPISLGKSAGLCFETSLVFWLGLLFFFFF